MEKCIVLYPCYIVNNFTFITHDVTRMEKNTEKNNC